MLISVRQIASLILLANVTEFIEEYASPNIPDRIVFWVLPEQG